MPDGKRLRALLAARHLRRLRHAVRVDAEAHRVGGGSVLGENCWRRACALATGQDAPFEDVAAVLLYLVSCRTAVSRKRRADILSVGVRQDDALLRTPVAALDGVARPRALAALPPLAESVRASRVADLDEAFGLERDIVSARAHLAVERRSDLAARLHAAVLRVVLVDLHDAAVAAGAGAVDERPRVTRVQRLDASRLVGVEAACASHHAIW